MVSSREQLNTRPAKQAKILVVDDEQSALDLLRNVLAREGYDIHATRSGVEAANLASEEEYDLLISDIMMPDVGGLDVLRAARRARPELPVIMVTAFGSMDTAIQAMQEGAFDYLTKPFKIEELKIVCRRALEAGRTSRELRYLREGLRAKYRLENIVGTSPGMLEIFKLVGRVAGARATVLIQGETGTGKELIARTIHAHGPRADRPFVTVNCGALAESLLESELFGHVKGAFTGAHAARRGLFEEADGGTLFLDEVGDTTPALQMKLLRALQEGEIRRVGGSETIRVDVRVIAATHRDLEAAVRQGTFREDLFFRLNAVTLHLPPLRARPVDIPLLAEHFLRRFADQNERNVHGISPEALDLLTRYPWPGNVRELEHIVERAVVLASQPVITPEDLPRKMREASAASSPVGEVELVTLEEIQRRHLQQVLEATGGNKRRAAEILGIDRGTLYRMLERFEIPGPVPED